jgi:hypothetical protein
MKAEQETQEVIAKWIKANTEHRQWYICPKCSYQAPRFRDEWVGLTDDEMLMIYAQPHEGFKYSLGRMVQAALKEKNA